MNAGAGFQRKGEERGGIDKKVPLDREKGGRRCADEWSPIASDREGEGASSSCSTCYSAGQLTDLKLGLSAKERLGGSGSVLGLLERGKGVVECAATGPQSGFE
jgi:hypothetical protein